MEKNDLFIEAVREYLNLKPDDYCWDEPLSSFGHQFSNMCRWFYNRGVKDTFDVWGEKNERL